MGSNPSRIQINWECGESNVTLSARVGFQGALALDPRDPRIIHTFRIHFILYKYISVFHIAFIHCVSPLEPVIMEAGWRTDLEPELKLVPARWPILARFPADATAPRWLHNVSSYCGSI